MRNIIVTILLCAVVVGSGIGLFQWWRIRREMDHELHPIWRDLNSGKIVSGVDVEEFVKEYQATLRQDRGPFSELTYYKDYDPSLGIYFSGVFMFAKDGIIKRASADSCVWRKTFFDELAPNDNESWSALIEEEHAKSQDQSAVQDL